MTLERRAFLKGVASVPLAVGGGAGTAALFPAQAQQNGANKGRAYRAYNGPNIIIIRFGGGVRRRETIDPNATYAPFLRHELTRRGAFIPDMMIGGRAGVETSHAEGTLNILTGRYLAYRDLESPFLQQHLLPTQPTLFEYFRRAYHVPSHQALLINGEDRPQEEFFTFGAHHKYGVAYRSEMLSLHRFKLYKLRRLLARSEKLDDKTRKNYEKQYAKLLQKDYRKSGPRQPAPIEQFWAKWQAYYGNSGLVNPRGDRLLTELALRAVDDLRPKLMMINYQDPDYVHWGNRTHYTRAISIIDEGLKRLVAKTDSDPHYRGRTIFVIVPDCGRDANSLMQVPFQHHFNSRSAHEIWALIFGPGIVKNKILDRQYDQIELAATIGAMMGMATPASEARAIEDVFI